MHISSWAAMTKRHRGRRWRCRTIRTFNLDYGSPPQAMQWPGGRSKHTRQRLGCGNSIPRYVFPISKTCWALIGVPNTSRDTMKDCGKPGCPNDDRSQMLARGDEVIERGTSVVVRWHIATFRCAAEFGRYRGIADIEQVVPIKFDL